MLASWIATYGYAALFVGTLLEGETILIAAGFASHRGLLDLRLVIPVPALGATVGDQVALLVGHWWSQQVLALIPRIGRLRPKLQARQDRWAWLMVLILRFLYGFRLAGPFLLGDNGLDPLRFFVLNFVSALVWAVTFATLGYLVGAALETLIADVKEIEEGVLLAILLFGLVFWCVRRFRRWRTERLFHFSRLQPHA